MDLFGDLFVDFFVDLQVLDHFLMRFHHPVAETDVDVEEFPDVRVGRFVLLVAIGHTS